MRPARGMYGSNRRCSARGPSNHLVKSPTSSGLAAAEMAPAASHYHAQTNSRAPVAVVGRGIVAWTPGGVAVRIVIRIVIAAVSPRRAVIAKPEAPRPMAIPAISIATAESTTETAVAAVVITPISASEASAESAIASAETATIVSCPVASPAETSPITPSATIGPPAPATERVTSSGKTASANAVATPSLCGSGGSQAKE